LLILAVCPSPLLAHDPPEEYYGRNVTITLEPGAVKARYRMELSQVSLFNLPRNDERIRIGAARGRSVLEAACMERFKVLIPDRILAFLNDRPLTWVVEKTSISQMGSTHFELQLRADWLPNAGKNRFEVTDENFPDAPGLYRLAIDADGVDCDEIDNPARWESKGVPPAMLRSASASFQGSAAGLSDRPNTDPVANESAAKPERSIWDELHDDNLAALLGTNYGFGLLLLFALIHGAGHSLMPGHGKTMVAAYLIGERGTPWHAVLLGIVTTLTHTSAAIGIAILLRYGLPAQSEKGVDRVLQFAGGLLMAGIGVWLFLQRIAGRSDHVHLFDMGHGHSHGDAPPPSIGKAGIVRLVLLGIAGGIIPCWGAVMWVIGCIATGQTLLALPIVLAFSVGLASVLILIGLSVVYSGRLGSRHWGNRRWFKLIFNEQTRRALPVVGAAVIIAIGLYLTAASGMSTR